MVNDMRADTNSGDETVQEGKDFVLDRNKRQRIVSPES